MGSNRGQRGFPRPAGHGEEAGLDAGTLMLLGIRGMDLGGLLGDEHLGTWLPAGAGGDMAPSAREYVGMSVRVGE